MALIWERLKANTHQDITTYRTKVPGGWLILVHIKNNTEVGTVRVPSITFYPDPHYLWTGSTLEDPSDILLRPATGQPIFHEEELLRPSNLDLSEE